MNKQTHSSAPAARSRRTVFAALLLVAAAGLANAQMVGSTLTATAVIQVREVTVGWSVSRQVLGRDVVNEYGDAVGRVDDIILSPDASVSHLVIGTPGGFLGLRRHEVAVPASLLLLADDKFVLVGSQPGSLELMPAFEYAR
jgi:sporulation protein YlmC with PRC-barrel domain